MATAEDRALGVLALRADAARNRALIVAAAAEVFAERGLEASTAEIADRAGVGEATVYRRFPTKEDLIAAIVAAHMEEALEIADRCLQEPDAWKALESFLLAMGERTSSDQGLSDAAKESCIAGPELTPLRKRLLDVCGELVRRGQRAGVVREDVAGQDVLFVIAAVSSLGELPFPGLRDDLWKRYLGLLLDGLRPEGATKLRPGAPARRLIELPETG